MSSNQRPQRSASNGNRGNPAPPEGAVSNAAQVHADLLQSPGRPAGEAGQEPPHQVGSALNAETFLQGIQAIATANAGALTTSMTAVTQAMNNFAAQQQAQLQTFQQALDEQRRQSEQFISQLTQASSTLQAQQHNDLQAMMHQQAQAQQAQAQAQAQQQQQQQQQQQPPLYQQAPAAPKMPLVKAPPEPPTLNDVRKINSKVPDPVKLCLEWRAIRSSIKLRARSYAMSLANHFKASVANYPVGDVMHGYRFADRTEQQTVTDFVYTSVFTDCMAMFEYTDPGNTKQHWQATQWDVTGIPQAENQIDVAQIQCEALTLMEEFLYKSLFIVTETDEVQLQVVTHQTEMHNNLNNTTARGSATLFDLDSQFDPKSRWEGMRLILKYQRFQPTGNTNIDMRSRDTIRAQIDAFYSDAAGVVNYERKNLETNIVTLFTDQTDPALLEELNKMMTTNSNILQSLASVQNFIREYSVGQNTLAVTDKQEAHILYDSDQEQAHLARDIDVCTQCGAIGKHKTAECKDAPCLMANCKRPAGKGHTEECIRYNAWIKNNMQRTPSRGSNKQQLRSKAIARVKATTSNTKKRGMKVNYMEDDSDSDHSPKAMLLNLQAEVGQLYREKAYLAKDDERHTAIDEGIENLQTVIDNISKSTADDRAGSSKVMFATLSSTDDAPRNRIPCAAFNEAPRDQPSCYADQQSKKDHQSSGTADDAPRQGLPRDKFYESTGSVDEHSQLKAGESVTGPDNLRDSLRKSRGSTMYSSDNPLPVWAIPATTLWERMATYMHSSMKACQWTYMQMFAGISSVSTAVQKTVQAVQAYTPDRHTWQDMKTGMCSMYSACKINNNTRSFTSSTVALLLFAVTISMLPAYPALSLATAAQHAYRSFSTTSSSQTGTVYSVAEKSCHKKCASYDLYQRHDCADTTNALQEDHFKSKNRGRSKYGKAIPHSAPAGFQWQSTIFDPGATVNTQNSTDNCYDVCSINASLSLAAKGPPMTVTRQGQARLLVLDDKGKLRSVTLGRTLIDPSLRNLCSASTVFKHSQQVSKFVMSRDKAYILLATGDKVPLRFDGRLWYIDHLVKASNTNSSQGNIACAVTESDDEQSPVDIQWVDDDLYEQFAIGMYHAIMLRQSLHSTGDITPPDSPCSYESLLCSEGSSAVQFSDDDLEEDMLNTFSELVRDEHIPDSTLTPVIEAPNMYRQHRLHRAHCHCSEDTLQDYLQLHKQKAVRTMPTHKVCGCCALSSLRQIKVDRQSREHARFDRTQKCHCEDCMAERQTEVFRHTTYVGQSISADLAGPFKVPSTSGAVYMVVFVDHFSRFTWVDFIKKKSSRLTLLALQRFQQHIGKSVKRVHTDGGAEFLGHFSTYLRENSIKHTVTCPYSAFQNSICERRIGTIKNYARRIMLDSGLPQEFWARAMHTACFVMNQHRVYDSPVNKDKSPYMVAFPDKAIPKLYVFGAVAYTLILPKLARDTNLRYPAYAGIFMGYSDFRNGYVIYNPTTKQYQVRRDVVFDENWRYNKRLSPDTELDGCLDIIPVQSVPTTSANQQANSEEVSQQGGQVETSETTLQQGGQESQTVPDQGGLDDEAIRQSLQEASQSQPAWIPSNDVSEMPPTRAPVPGADPPPQSQTQADEPEDATELSPDEAPMHEPDTLPDNSDNDRVRLYIELFCGTSSFAVSKLRTDPICKVKGSLCQDGYYKLDICQIAATGVATLQGKVQCNNSHPCVTTL